MSSTLKPLIDSLELAAEAQADIYDLAFERYFELCPESKELLQHSDELMRGRMMEQVMGLLMDTNVAELDTYFKFEISNHEGYGAAVHMYRHLFQACKEVTKAGNGNSWTAQAESAWDAQIDVMLGLVSKYSSQ